MKKFVLVSAFVFAAFNFAVAQEEVKKQPPVKLLLGGALELGGDEVAEVYFTNGDVQSVRAGQGGSVAIGAQLQLPNVEKLLFRGTLGYKYVTTQADNAHIRLTRVPLIFTANWMATDKIRIGAGLASHQAIRFKADGIGNDITFKAANGPTFEVAYGVVGLSFTAMKYKDNSNISYSANAIGLTVSGVLPKK